jgi:hypothetical protein
MDLIAKFQCDYQYNKKKTYIGHLRGKKSEALDIYVYFKTIHQHRRIAYIWCQIKYVNDVFMFHISICFPILNS